MSIPRLPYVLRVPFKTPFCSPYSIPGVRIILHPFLNETFLTISCLIKSQEFFFSIRSGTNLRLLTVISTQRERKKGGQRH